MNWTFNFFDFIHCNRWGLEAHVNFANPHSLHFATDYAEILIERVF